MGTFRYVGDAFLISRGIHAVEQAVTDAAEDLVGQAQAVTPVDTGTLKASISTEGAEVSGNSVTATVQTGGEANDYAVYVHEGTSRGVSAFKFIENPLLENQAIYLAAMQRAARGAF